MLTIALTALLYYDYALTFGMEVKYMWGQKFRISTVLYIWCRYALVANIIYLLTISGKIHIRVRSCPSKFRRETLMSTIVLLSMYSSTRIRFIVID
jgi:Family of unknown function (DUF6533)